MINASTVKPRLVQRCTHFHTPRANDGRAAFEPQTAAYVPAAAAAAGAAATVQPKALELRGIHV